MGTPLTQYNGYIFGFLIKRAFIQVVETKHDPPDQQLSSARSGKAVDSFYNPDNGKMKKEKMKNSITIRIPNMSKYTKFRQINNPCPTL